MLRQVRIENLVLAREVVLEFAPGLNLVTGETGAGKSLIVGGVALALGGRGDAGLVRQGEERAVVEALFDASQRPDILQRLARAGVETKGGHELLVRREIGADGRSRAFLNGATVTIAMLRDLLAGLVEMLGQHEPQTLLEPGSHRQMLDRFGELDELVAEVRRANHSLRETESRLAELRERAGQRHARLELLRFRIAEFDAVKPETGEEQRLRSERERLRHAENLGEAIRGALDALYEGEGAALERVHAASRRLRAQAAVDPAYGDLAERLEDVRGQLDDISSDLRGQLDDISDDPSRLEAIEERLLALERLRRRFDGAGLDEIVVNVTSTRREVDELLAQDDASDALVAERDAQSRAYREVAQRLSGARREAATNLRLPVAKNLAALLMPRAELQVQIESGAGAELAAQPAGADGLDTVEFLLAANPGEPARPLRRVASGGELSRLMLALHLSLERTVPRRTLFFDEVDQGLGGEAADVLGEFLAQLSKRHQVICVTHLAQVAARADRHVHVTKKIKAGRTVAVVKTLEDDDERALELARMLGGPMVTETARRHAEAMLSAARGNG